MITLIALCIVLMTDLLKKWIWETDVAMWFLILVLNTTIVEVELDEALSIILSSSLICFLTLGEQGWKARQSRNKSVRQFPSLNSSLKKENEGKNLLHLLSTSMSEDFKQNLCLAVR